MQAKRLTIKQTATGYWTVERDAVSLAGAMTRRAAEAERDMLNRLRGRRVRRARTHSVPPPGPRAGSVR